MSYLQQYGTSHEMKPRSDKTCINCLLGISWLLERAKQIFSREVLIPECDVENVGSVLSDSYRW